MKHILILILSACTLFSCTKDNGSPDPQEPLESVLFRNVSYGHDPDQVYDIYLPKNRTTETKTMILIHGGGWTSGDKKDMQDFMNFFQVQLPDIAVVNMNYRLADTDHPPYPMQIDDITAVVKKINDKQKEYQLGPELGFMGVSAGGHLSLLWSYGYDTNHQVNMVCSMVGPTNLADSAYVNPVNPVLQGLFSQFGEDFDFLKKVSPLYQANTSSPPTLLFYGGKDPLIPISQGSSLNDRLKELNVVHEFTLYPEGGHGWVGQDVLIPMFLKYSYIYSIHMIERTSKQLL